MTEVPQWCQCACCKCKYHVFCVGVLQVVLHVLYYGLHHTGLVMADHCVCVHMSKQVYVSVHHYDVLYVAQGTLLLHYKKYFTLRGCNEAPPRVSSS